MLTLEEYFTSNRTSQEYLLQLFEFPKCSIACLHVTKSCERVALKATNGIKSKTVGT